MTLKDWFYYHYGLFPQLKNFLKNKENVDRWKRTIEEFSFTVDELKWASDIMVDTAYNTWPRSHMTSIHELIMEKRSEEKESSELICVRPIQLDDRPKKPDSAIEMIKQAEIETRADRERFKKSDPERYLEGLTREELIEGLVRCGHAPGPAERIVDWWMVGNIRSAGQLIAGELKSMLVKQ